MGDDTTTVDAQIDSQTEVGEDVKESEKDPISKSKKDVSSSANVEVQAEALVQRMFREKSEQREIKNALKAYKVTSEKIEELKKARKEFTQQINEEKYRIEAEFQKDKTYNELREKLLDAEEKVAVAKQDLRVLLHEKAMQNEFVEMQFEIDGMPFKLQTQAKVALYFNGKEEK